MKCLMGKNLGTYTNGKAVLNDEVQTAMRLLGARNVKDLGPQHVCNSVDLFVNWVY